MKNSCWTPQMRYIHTQVEEIPNSQRDYPNGTATVKMRCLYCGMEWKTELPQ